MLVGSKPSTEPHIHASADPTTPLPKGLVPVTCDLTAPLEAGIALAAEGCKASWCRRKKMNAWFISVVWEEKREVQGKMIKHIHFSFSTLLWGKPSYYSFQDDEALPIKLLASLVIHV